MMNNNTMTSQPIKTSIQLKRINWKSDPSKDKIKRREIPKASALDTTGTWRSLTPLGEETEAPLTRQVQCTTPTWRKHWADTKPDTSSEQHDENPYIYETKKGATENDHVGWQQWLLPPKHLKKFNYEKYLCLISVSDFNY